MDPHLSILITYYNEGKLLSDCLESLNLLSHKELVEVIIYDDASNESATAYIPSNYPVKIIRGRENKGPSYGRNVLLNESKGKYIHFHDADDLFNSNWLDKIFSRIGKSDIDIVVTDASNLKTDYQIVENIIDLSRVIGFDYDLVRLSITGDLLVPTATFRRDIAKGIGGFRDRNTLPLAEDFDFFTRLAANCHSCDFIFEPLVIVRSRAESHSRDRKLLWESVIKAIELLAGELPNQYLTDLAESAARFGSYLFLMGHTNEARRAFVLASSIGQPCYKYRGRNYQIVATLFGPEVAERVGMFYRKALANK